MDRSWRLWGTLFVLAALAVGGLLGFIVMPVVQGRAAGIDFQNVITNGDVARALPPCSACHQVRAGGPIETPTLTGQYAQYIEAQLKAFADGARHNDIYHRNAQRRG
jgi:cytochrome c553